MRKSDGEDSPCAQGSKGHPQSAANPSTSSLANEVIPPDLLTCNVFLPNHRIPRGQGSCLTYGEWPSAGRIDQSLGKVLSSTNFGFTGF